MTAALSLSKHRPRKFWGWGYDDDQLTQAEEAALAARGKELAGRDGLNAGPAPKTSDFELRKPRIDPPAAIGSCFSTTPHDRLWHAYGRSFPDILRMWMRDVPNPPDLVAFPETEDQIAAILDWAGRSNVAVIPFGGGSSVVGGVEPAVGDSYAATISLDLERFDKVHEIDSASRAARIGAGIYGPALEDQLRPNGLTLRHYPQSFQLSTLGGWIVTRSGGHYATAKTHIDEMVESTRMVTPSGVIESRRLPGSGAGAPPPTGWSWARRAFSALSRKRGCACRIGRSFVPAPQYASPTCSPPRGRCARSRNQVSIRPIAGCSTRMRSRSITSEIANLQP